LHTKVIGPDGHETAVKNSVYWAREFGENSVIVKANDISKQMDLTQELQRGQERFSRLVDNAIDMICSCKGGTVSFINKSGVKFLNAETRDQIIGPSVASFFHENYQEIFGEFIQGLMQDDDRFPAKLARFDGTHVDVHIAITQTDPSSYQNYMLEVRDISEHRRAVMALHYINLDLEKRVKERTRELSQEIIIRKKAEKKLRLMVTHDSLTGLPNRSLLMDRIENAIAVAQRNNGNAALMFIDLDGFKAVNDSRGHNAGDALLKDIANRLIESVRKTDTVARIGGDGFVILLAAIPNEKMATSVATDVLEALSNPLDFNNKAANISGSIEISFYPQHGEDAEALLKQADSAMYSLKKRGENSISTASVLT
jgi:diguanylate cyclase (GGDEF)-like protein